MEKSIFGSKVTQKVVVQRTPVNRSKKSTKDHVLPGKKWTNILRTKSHGDPHISNQITIKKTLLVSSKVLDYLVHVSTITFNYMHP